MKLPVTAFALTFSITALAAQDPLAVLPASYSKQFENEWVRVVRVRYAPHATLPAHAHNALPAAYVYLNDGGPVLFKHIGASYGAATRPATKAGSFRVFRGIDEIHEVENRSELPSDFLRVEFQDRSQGRPNVEGPVLQASRSSRSERRTIAVRERSSAHHPRGLRARSPHPAFRRGIRAFAADRLPGDATP